MIWARKIAFGRGSDSFAIKGVNAQTATHVNVLVREPADQSGIQELCLEAFLLGVEN